MTRIDAHHHLWDRSQADFDYSWQESKSMSGICRDFLPEHLLPLIQQAEIDRTVVVQTQHHLQENRWALQLAERHDWIAGVVGWVDLTGLDCEDQVLEFKQHPKFVGVRHVVQDEPDDEFMVRDDVWKGLAVLQRHSVPYDLLFYARHLQHVTTVAKRFPELPLVINHLSKPQIKSGKIADWKQEIRNAAAHQNVFCKLSGMVTEADWNGWTVDDLRPYADVVIESFGPERLMFGSDWPVCTLAADYQTVHATTLELIRQLSDDEQGKIMGGTAQRFYGLADLQAGASSL